MTSDTDLVELTTAHSPLEAEWLVGALKGHGIHAIVFGDGLADEFAMSQKLMGLGGGVRVMVPRGALEAAREALAQLEQERPTPEALEAAFEAAPALESEEASPTESAPSSRTGSTAAIVLLTAAVIVLGGIALKQRDTISAYESENHVTKVRWLGDRLEYRWREGGARARVYIDRGNDYVYEEAWEYDRTGRPFRHSLDKNQNEIYELTLNTDAEGKPVLRVIDENENGIPERFEYAPQDGVTERWLDSDEDWRAERLEFVDAATGEVLEAFEHRGRRGYVRIPSRER